MADTNTTTTPVGAPPTLETEFAHRLLDPFEQLYLGLLRTNDPLLLEKGSGGSGAALYQDLARDGKVFSAMQKRVLALVGREWQVEPVTDSPKAEEDAEKLTDLLKCMGFDQLCGGLMSALLTGIAIHELVWTVRDGYYTVDRAPARALRRFVFVQEPDQPPELRMLTRSAMLTGEPLPHMSFIVHRVNPLDDNPWGTGLGLQLYWAVLFKRKAIISWNKLNDRVGVPTPWGQYPDGAKNEDKATLFSALKALANDGVVMTPVGTRIELLESKIAAGGITTQQGLCEYMDDWIAEVLLGDVPRQQGGGAMAAASKERSAVRLDLVQADADLLSDTLNRTLIRWLCELNGFEPCLVSRVIKEEDDLKAMAETDKTVSDMGFELDLDQVQAKYGEGWRKKAAPPPASAMAGAPGLADLAGQQDAGAGATAAADAEAEGSEDGAAGGDAQQTASFAERGQTSGQQAIDDALAALPDAHLQDALQAMLAPLMAAVAGARTFDDALAAAERAYPAMDSSQLQSMLASAMFGAEAFGRQSTT